jgi:hypothetical protein
MKSTDPYIIASGFYLTEVLPEDFGELDEQEVMDFIKDHKWGLFEDWEPHGIWELIDALAREFHNQTNHETSRT